MKSIRKIEFGKRLVYVGGPCVIESHEHCLRHAQMIKKIAAAAGVDFIFKSSYDKANRMSLSSYRGVGFKEGMKILSDVKKRVKVRILTDVHTPEEAEKAAEYIDVLQIPAFLCRQTDLVVTAAKTGRPLNIKKGQFLSPWDMKYIADKAEKAGAKQIILCERGTTFGYGYLVNDMRAIPIMKSFGYPVLFDAGHSVQLPGQAGGKSGGMRDMIPTLAKAGIASGADGLYLEVHENPDAALSDGPNMLRLSDLSLLLLKLVKIRQASA